MLRDVGIRAEAFQSIRCELCGKPNDSRVGDKCKKCAEEWAKNARKAERRSSASADATYRKMLRPHTKLRLEQWENGEPMTPYPEGDYDCPLCKVQCLDQTALSNHIKHTHPKEQGSE